MERSSARCDALIDQLQEDLIRAERSKEHETSFVVLSDLHLDNHKILAALRSVLEAYEGMDDISKPSLFVLCGNFRTRPFLFDGEATREYTGASHLISLQQLIKADKRARTELFATLATLLLAFPSLLAHSRFLLVPGPTDPWSSLTLPRPALPASMVKSLADKIPTITFGSNPCRVRYFSQEIVIFREDIMGRMMRNAVRLGGEKDTDLRKAVSVFPRSRDGSTVLMTTHGCSWYKRYWIKLICPRCR